LPNEVDVPPERAAEEEVAWALADDLVRDVGIPDVDVTGSRGFHTMTVCRD
jgi:hypothetical protein